MKSILCPIILTLLFVSSVYLPVSFGQDAPQSHLPEGVKSRLGKGDINEVKYSPDGTKLGVATSLGIWIYDAQTGGELNLLTGHTGPVRSVAFSPDGRTLASGSDDLTLRLWDVSTGREIRPFSGHKLTVGSVAFSPDGRTLASGSADDTLRLWDVETGREIRVFSGHTNGVLSVAFSPDGRTLASASFDTIYLWDVGTGREIRTFSGHTDWVYSVAFSPDGRTLASGSSDKTFRLWDVETGREIRVFSGHTGWIDSVAFSPDGRTLASASYDETIRLWDVGTGREIRVFSGHTGWIDSVAFSPDGRTLASGSADGTLRLWDVETGREIRTFSGHTSSVISVAFSPDGRTLACGNWGATIPLWDANTGRRIRTLPRSALSVAFSPDGGTLASGSYGTLHLWDVGTGREIRTLTGHTNRVLSVAFSPDGRTLASGSRDETLRLWDVETGREIRTFTGHTHWVYSVAFSPDGRTLASGSRDETLRLWDVETGREIRTFIGHTGSVESVAFSPDGRTLASGSADTIYLWDVNTGTTRTRSAASVIRSVAFSPDGRTLASASFDTIYLWDANTGRHIQNLIGHTGSVNSVAFSPDGRTLASGSSDGTVLLWDVTPETADSQQYQERVRLIYFRPSDRPLRDFDAALDTLITETQQFYAEQMQNHGYGRKTFILETDANDTPVVHYINGQFTDAYYQQRTYERVRQEISKRFDISLNVYLAVIDVRSQGIGVSDGTTVDGVAGGRLAVIPAFGPGFSVGVAAHELGHTFGLDHDFRDDTYIMAYGSSQRLSDCAAEWLDVSRFFNTAETFFNEPTTIEILSKHTNRLRFQITDADRLHQVQLLIPTTAADPDSSGVKLHSYKALNGKTNSTVEFAATVLRETSSVEVKVKVIDRLGYITDRTFQVAPDEDIPMDVNGDGVVNILDLTFVASHFGQTGGNAADVNSDGVVNIVDIVLVAGALGDTAAAPTLWSLDPGMAPTLADVEQWLSEAEQVNLTDPTARRGILFLRQLLAYLTPKETALLANYPNPLNPETWIPYQLAAPAEVHVCIYAPDGTLVRTLQIGHQAIGIYQSRSRAAYWDGRNALGEPVASGVYFYTLTAGDFTATRKMLIRK